jgi:hypothetical protein
MDLARSLMPDDGDSEMRILLRAYESCRTPTEKRVGARLVADRLDEMAVAATGEKAERLRDEAAQWRSLYSTLKED